MEFLKLHLKPSNYVRPFSAATDKKCTGEVLSRNSIKLA